MAQLASWEAGGTENLWAFPKKIEIKTQSFISAANVALAGVEPAKLRPIVLPCHPHLAGTGGPLCSEGAVNPCRVDDAGIGLLPQPCPGRSQLCDCPGAQVENQAVLFLDNPNHILLLDRSIRRWRGGGTKLALPKVYLIRVRL